MKQRLLTLSLGALLLPALALAQPNTTFPNFRPYDQRGVNVFEAAKDDTDVSRDYKDRLRFGAAFTQQFQALDHRNTALEVKNAAGVNTNQLLEIGSGFNLATANVSVDAILADGIRVNLTSYLSSRHHSETWVKGGFVQVDRLPMIKNAIVDGVMDHLTLRVGHFGINYGDAQFRRTDNGNALYNPFVGNYIMDAFTTEIGGEALVRFGSAFVMGALTGGEIQGGVAKPQQRNWAKLAKVGFDRQFTPLVRARLSGSLYTTPGSASNTLYGGDRAGSRYYSVLENTLSSTGGNFTSGQINPGFREKVTAFQINPFVKVGGFEVFGVIEQGKGRSAIETLERTWNQYAVDAVYRFMPREQVFVGVRYNTVNGPLTGPVNGPTTDVAIRGKITTAGQEISIDRFEVGAGWFATRSLLLKGAYVRTDYRDFPTNDIRNGGRFNGFMVEGVIAF